MAILNQAFSPMEKVKLNSIKFLPPTDNYNVKVHVFAPIAKESSDDSLGGTSYEFSNYLNTAIKSGTTTEVKIFLSPDTVIASADGTINVKILRGDSGPLDSRVKGENTIAWLQNNENIVCEWYGKLDNSIYLRHFAFESPSLNLLPSETGEKETASSIYYVSNYEPITDKLRFNEEASTETIYHITFTKGLSANLQNPETGSLLNIRYILQPAQPKNARYIKLTYKSSCFHNSISMKEESGVPISNLKMIDENNKTPELEEKGLVSDNWFIDLVWAMSVVGSQSIWNSMITGEIFNKWRIWDSMFKDYGKKGHFDFIAVKNAANNFYTNENGYANINLAPNETEKWSDLFPNTNYFIGGPPGLSSQFDAEIEKSLGENITASNAVTPWYNFFSFFNNIYSIRSTSTTGTATWKTNNSFFAMDVQKANAGIVHRLENEMVVSNPRRNIKNPNLNDDYYFDIVRKASLGNVTINGQIFNKWDLIMTQLDKEEYIYDQKSADDKKYLVLFPKMEYKERTSFILENGDVSLKNDLAVKVGKSQTHKNVHLFPTGDGSVQNSYDSNIFYLSAYAESNGWPVDNKIVFDLGGEFGIKELTLNVWGGEKIKIEYFDAKMNPAVGVNSDGTTEILPPSISNAPNNDTDNNPLKASKTISYAFA